MRTRSLSFLFLPLLLSACTVTVVEDRWTPVGTDIAVYGTYDIANAPGATLAEACEFAGIDSVELIIIDSTGAYSELASLWEYCGDSGEIDTVSAILASGNYQYFWRAYDANNNVVSESTVGSFGPANVGVDGYFDAGHFEFPVDYGSHVVLDVTLEYATGSTPAYSTCAGAGASGYQFNWTLYDLDPIDPKAVALYEDQGADYCWDWILIDDRAFDTLDIGTYYLEVQSVTDPGWAVVCDVDVQAYGYTAVTCPVPFG